MEKPRAAVETETETPTVWDEPLSGATLKEREAVGIAAIVSILLNGRPVAIHLMHTSLNGGC